MKPQNDLTAVIQNNLCIACGACTAADNELTLQLNPTTLMYEPSAPGSSAAAAVCPAIEVDYAALEQELFPNATTTDLGVVEAIMLAQSTNKGRNMGASSGGLIKELLWEFLERDEVDGAIVLAHVEGLRYEPTLLTTTAEIDKLPGSIYHNIPFDKALEILQQNEGRYVLVAIPCQLEGIFTYITKMQPALLDRIYTTIGLICGWTYSHHSLKALAQFKRVPYQAIQDVSYRGGGPVGPLKFELPDRTVSINRRKDYDYMAAFDRSYNVPRCHLCVNHINYLADIVVGDAWLTRVAKTESGVSIIICRTPEAVEVMEKLERQGRINCAPANGEDIVESQSRRFTYGDFAYAYAEYLKEQGEFVPDLQAPSRKAAQLVERAEVERQHLETQRKIQLQHAGRYRYLWWRKIWVDYKRYALRFAQKILSRQLRRHKRQPMQDASEISNFR